MYNVVPPVYESTEAGQFETKKGSKSLHQSSEEGHNYILGERSSGIWLVVIIISWNFIWESFSSYNIIISGETSHLGRLEQLDCHNCHDLKF